MSRLSLKVFWFVRHFIGPLPKGGVSVGRTPASQGCARRQNRWDSLPGSVCEDLSVWDFATALAPRPHLLPCHLSSSPGLSLQIFEGSGDFPLEPLQPAAFLLLPRRKNPKSSHFISTLPHLPIFSAFYHPRPHPFYFIQLVPLYKVGGAPETMLFEK